MGELKWKTISTIPSFELYTGYEVSSDGEIKSFRQNKRGKLLKPVKNRYGYLQVGLCGGAKRLIMRVHRLVMLAFEFREDHASMTVNHRDFDKTNNRLENLEWLSNAENVRHYHETVVMTRAEADAICRDFKASDMTQLEFAGTLGISPSWLSSILVKRTTTGLYTTRVQPSKYSEKERDAIALAYIEGTDSQRAVAKQFGVSHTTVCRYVREFKRKGEDLK